MSGIIQKKPVDASGRKKTSGRAPTKLLIDFTGFPLNQLTSEDLGEPVDDIQFAPDTDKDIVQQQERDIEMR